MTTSPLETVAILVTSVASFQIAYEWEVAAGFILTDLACLLRLAWVNSGSSYKRTLRCPEY